MTGRPMFVATLAFAATFVAGVLASRAYDAWSRHAAGSVAATTWADTERELGLSESQRDAIQAIFARYQPSTDSVFASLIPRLRTTADSMQRDIDAVLDSVQRRTLQSLQSPALYLIKRKTLEGSRVDTVVGGKSR